jgi:hypothetical protein
MADTKKVQPEKQEQQQAAPVQPQSINMVSPDGGSYSVSIAEAREAMQKGWRVEQPEETKKRVLEEEKGTTAGVIKSAALGAARGLSFGLSDVLLTETGGILTPQEAKEYKEANPIASTVGEVGGMIAPTLLSSGTSLIGQGARGVSAGVRAAQAVGTAAEKGVAKILGDAAGKSLARRVIQKGIEKGAGSFTEGLFFGTGQLVTEQTLGDTPLTAEKVISHIGLGALVGGAVGGGLGAGGVLAKEAAEATKRVAMKALETTSHAPSVGEFYSKVSKYFTGKDVSDFIGSPDAAKNRAIATAGDEMRVKAARSMAELEDRMMSAADDTFDQAIGVNKERGIKAVMTSGVDDDIARASSIDAVNEIKKIADNMVDEITSKSGEYGHVGAVKKIQQTVENTFNKLDTFDEDVAGNVFIELDVLKRDIGKIIKRTQRIRDPQSADMASQDMFKNMYERLKTHLEADDIFGAEAAAMQKDVNASWVDYLKQSEYRPDSRFHKLWERDEWDKSFKADPGGYERYINNLGRAKNDLDEKFLLEHMQARQKVMDAIERNYDIDDALKARIQQSRQDLDEFTGLLAETEKAVNLQNKFSEIVKGEAEQGFMGSAAGAVVGGLPGAVIGGGLGAALSPGKMISRLAQIDRIGGNMFGQVGTLSALERAAGKTTRQIGSAIGDFIEQKQPQKLIVPTAISILDEAVLGDEKPTMKTTANMGAQYNKKLTALSKKLADPVALQNQVSDNIAHLRNVAPDIADTMAAQTIKTLSFLYEKAPKPPATELNTLQPQHSKWQPTDTEIAKWSKYVRAANQPMSVLDDLKAGTLSFEATETLKTLYPGMYAEIGQQIAERAAQHPEEIPYDKRVQLSLLFGVPADKTLTPDFIAFAQSQYQQTQQQEQPGVGQKRGLAVKDPILPKTTMTKMERIEVK